MISAIVTVFDAAPTLGACLAALDGAGEIIVVDGGSGDGSQAIATASGARLIAAPKGRGLQLRAGGDAATGDWLLFLHADTLLAPGWRDAAIAHSKAEPDKAACFRLQLDDPAWQARLIEKGVRLRSRLGLPYGDQGLLISRTHYDALDGYAPLPLMEDVDLVRRIGRRRLRMLDIAASTSAKRWRDDGWLRRSARNLFCLALYRLGMPADRIARLYA